MFYEKKRATAPCDIKYYYYYVVFVLFFAVDTIMLFLLCIFFFPTKQISTVTITDRFSLTTHVVESFMPVPKHRATTMFLRTFKYPLLRGVYSAAAGTASIASPRISAVYVRRCTRDER